MYWLSRPPVMIPKCSLESQGNHCSAVSLLTLCHSSSMEHFNFLKHINLLLSNKVKPIFLTLANWFFSYKRLWKKLKFLHLYAASLGIDPMREWVSLTPGRLQKETRLGSSDHQQEEFLTKSATSQSLQELEPALRGTGKIDSMSESFFSARLV